MSIAIETEYRKKRLDEFEYMGDMEIIKLVKDHPSYEKYVAAVKQIIDFGEDRQLGFQIDFNSDYTKVRKMITLDQCPVILKRR